MFVGHLCWQRERKPQEALQNLPILGIRSRVFTVQVWRRFGQIRACAISRSTALGNGSGWKPAGYFRKINFFRNCFMFCQWCSLTRRLWRKWRNYVVFVQPRNDSGSEWMRSVLCYTNPLYSSSTFSPKIRATLPGVEHSFWRLYSPYLPVASIMLMWDSLSKGKNISSILLGVQTRSSPMMLSPCQEEKYRDRDPQKL